MADARRRLRSGTVVLGGMGVLAAALSACSSEPDKRCVDRDSYNLTKGYKVVADKNCKSTSGTSGKAGKSATAATDDAWYYGGDKKGSWVDGGSFTKPGKGSSGSTGSSSSSGGSSSGSSGGGGVDRNGFGGDSDSGSGVGKGSSGKGSSGG
ncbi:hypothetical protein ACIRPU_22485 [Streptomyces sp. NPDC102259]|uniref:hypothetical protein n=1 Tax=Streptomyces sp. NPDC102259 TaxID=3366148 RepID=UPI00382BF54A